MHPNTQRLIAAVSIAVFLTVLVFNYSYNGMRIWQPQRAAVFRPHLHSDAGGKPVINTTFVSTAETSSMANEKPARHYRIKNLRVMAEPSYQYDSVLVMVVYNNKESWGRDRTVHDFIHLVKSFDHPVDKISLGILTSSEEEYFSLRDIFINDLATDHTTFSQVSIMLRQDFSINIARNNRKGDDVQKERRRMLARYRNYALIQSLEPWHEHVVWLDSDVVYVPTHLVSKMIASGKDILEPICYIENSETEYDLNAWAGMRKVPTPEELQKMHEGQLFVPMPDKDTKHMIDVRDHEYYPLDSVGGTMLYLKADIHRQGVLFTTHYVIGSEWKYEGYDGIETEGLCYVAGMLGYQCYGMPQDYIYHTNG